MENRNPYAAPRTNVTKGDGLEEYGDVKVFSVSGRLGRARYLAYSFGIGFLIFLLAGSVLTFSPDPASAFVVAIATYVASRSAVHADDSARARHEHERLAVVDPLDRACGTRVLVRPRNSRREQLRVAAAVEHDRRDLAGLYLP